MMRSWIPALFLFGACFVGSVLCPMQLAAAAITDSNFWDRVEGDLDGMRSFNELTRSSSATDEDLQLQASNLLVRLNASLTIYEKRPFMVSEEYDRYVGQIVAGISDYRDGLQKYSQALDTGDYQLSGEAVDEMNRGGMDIKQAISNLESVERQVVAQQNNEARQLHWAMLAGTVGIASLSALLLLLSMKQGTHDLEAVKASMHRGMFRASLIPLIGMIITFVGYERASGGGKYLVATGALLFGGFALLRKLFVYLTQVKPVLDAEIAADRILSIFYSNLRDLHDSTPEEEFERAISVGFRVRSDVARVIHRRLSPPNEPVAVPPSPHSPI